MKYKGAIFDVDGTLLDSMQMWDGLAAKFLLSRNVKPRENLNEQLSVIGGHEIAEFFRVEYGLIETIEEINHAIDRMLENFYFNIAPLKEGVFELIKSLSERGVKMCVATATDRWLIEPALRRCGIIEYFGRIFTCREEKTSKSSPEIYIRAAEFLETDIADTLVFEDALYAIKSAKKAGFPVVAVYDNTARDQRGEIMALSDYYFESLMAWKA